MSIQIRPARAADQTSINVMVRQARINLFDLDWRRFVVAAEADQIVATGQVRRHFDGSRELASIATAPSHQGRGLAGDVIRALLAADAAQPGPLFLMCKANLEPFYVHFGFRTAGGDNLPPYFRLMRFGMRFWDGRVMVREPLEHE